MELIIKKMGPLGYSWKTLAMQGNNVQGCLDTMQKESIMDLAINSEWGWKPANKTPTFLRDNPWIEGVMIMDENLDLTALNGVSRLKRLYLTDTFKGVLDFKNFPKLELFYGKWNAKQLKNIDQAVHIEWASISRFNENDLTFLRNFHRMKEFRIMYSNIINLHGIGDWQHVKKIELDNLPKLTDISELANVASHLRELSIFSCKRLTDYSVLSKLTSLESIIIGEGNPLGSADLLKDLPLKTGHLGIEVLDKQLRILDEKNITYKKFKSYSS
jgi:hypothetical protein